MLYLLDSNDDYDLAATELGVAAADVGQLITPLTGFANRGRLRFAIDNGAYSGFDSRRFQAILDRETPNRQQCLFVVVPDVVCSARRTLELFEYWYPVLHGWPLALACQNGQEDLPIPWDLIAAVFIGGDDPWKTSRAAEAIVRCAKAMGKWTHVGRAGGCIRAEVVEAWGTDSIDGSGISRYSAPRRRIADLRLQERLTLDEET